MAGSSIDHVHRYFATTVGLITTSGKHGRNVMAAEWTMQVSYDPMLIAIFIHDSPTLWNIKDTMAFGVNLASGDQAELVNIAGGYSGTEIDKLAIPGIFQTYRGRSVPMIRGCVLSAECKVRSIQEMGDHVMVVGEAFAATFDETKLPLIYTRGNYRRIGGKIPSGRKVARVSPAAFAEFKRMSQGQFVLKCASALARKKGGAVFLAEHAGSWIIPSVAVTRGSSYYDALGKHLGAGAKVGKMLGIRRFIIKSEDKELRANFIVFDCTIKSSSAGRWFSTLPRNTILRGLFVVKKPRLDY
ncbi:MAG: flavin reductase family protein [Nitrososphaera sp.]